MGMRSLATRGTLALGVLCGSAVVAKAAGPNGASKAAHPVPAGAPAGGAPAAGPGAIQPAAERTVVSSRPAGPGGLAAAAAPGRDRAAAGVPTVRGPRLPEALRVRLQARLDTRVTNDLAKAKQLRSEAIELLTKFVSESPRDAREMPEALVRLGELQWENEREGFVDRFAAWEKKPVDQRGPTPELDYRVARDLFGRVLRDYPWFSDYD